MITAPWTPAQQRLWDTAMLIERTKGAYGCAFPVPGTTFRPPTPGTMLHTLTFVASASEADVAAHLAAVRADMEAWRERVRNAPPSRRPLLIDIQDLEINI